jgi:alpha-tubulin suppressor-like RCC1 family protein
VIAKGEAGPATRETIAPTNDNRVVYLRNRHYDPDVGYFFQVKRMAARTVNRRTFLRLLLTSSMLAACSPRKRAELSTVTASPTATPGPRLFTPVPTPLPADTPVPTLTRTATPAVGPVITDSPITSLARGSFHGHALREDGRVYGWGKASHLGLSKDDEAVQVLPVLLPDVQEIRSIYANGFLSLFIDNDGRLHDVRPWYHAKRNAIFSGIDGVRQVATAHDRTMLALREDGTVWAWGDGHHGELGIGELTQTERFVRVPLDDVAYITFFQSQAFAVRSDGTLWFWGFTTDKGGAIKIIIPSPLQVGRVQNVQQVAGGDGLHILHTDGSVTAWENPGRILGDGIHTPETVPETVWDGDDFYPVTGIPPIIQIAGSNVALTLGVAEDHTLWAWGQAWSDAVYQATPPTFTPWLPEDRYTGRKIDLDGVVHAVANGGVIMALDRNGTVWAWGRSTYGGIGTGLVEGMVKEPTPIIVEETDLQTGS